MTMTSWLIRLLDGGPIAKPLGPLEARVLHSLWDRGTAASVRDLHPSFPDIAYTTLMTTLDRLYRKTVLSRTKRGRAFVYEPRLDRASYESARVVDALRVALNADDAALNPLLSCFVEAVSDRDKELLDQLESLIHARRAELDRHEP
jgi:predicted transcriptional regulator